MSALHAWLAGPFVQGFLFVALALFPVVNPLGMAPIFLRYTSGTDDGTRARLARRVAYNSFALAFVSLVAGSLVLRFFGLSLPAVQIAGGLVVVVFVVAAGLGSGGLARVGAAELELHVSPVGHPVTIVPGGSIVNVTVCVDGSPTPLLAAKAMS